MMTTPTMTPTPASPRTSAPVFTASDVHHTGNPTFNRWFGGTGVVGVQGLGMCTSGSYGTKRITPGRLAGGLT